MRQDTITRTNESDSCHDCYMFLSSPELPNASAASNVPEDMDMAIEGDEEMAIDGELPHFSETTTTNNFLYN